MSEHLPQGVVLSDPLLQPIVVEVQVKPDYATDDDRPARHPGAPGARVDLRGDFCFEQLAARRARGRVLVQVRQTAQNLRDVVT